MLLWDAFISSVITEHLRTIKVSSLLVWVSILLLFSILVVCCFNILNEYQKVSLNLNDGVFLRRMNQSLRLWIWPHFISKR